MHKSLKLICLALLTTIWANHSNACTGLGTPTITGSVVGTNLTITVNSTTIWGCTYSYEAEIACATGAYTGVPTFPAPASGTITGGPGPYAPQVIDLSGYCPGNYKLRVREVYSTWGFSPYSADFFFTVPGATLTVAASASPISICFPGTTDLTATPSAACGAVNYTWDNGGGPGQTVTVSPSTTTTYTVTATDATSCVTTTSSVTVTSLPAPVAGIAAVAPASVCEGGTVTLSLTGETGTIQWQSGPTAGGPWTDIGGATTNSEVIGPLNLGDDLFFQAVVTSCGTVTTNVVAVTVNPDPIITAPADFSVCEGTSVTITGVGAVSYTWTGGVVDGVPFVPPVGTTTYTVTGTDANGCTGTDDLDITVNPLPTIGAGPDIANCDDGTLVTLSGTGGVSYTWTGGITDGVAFLPSLGTTTYTVIGTDANGCQNTDMVDVTVYANPTIIAPADFSVCEGTSVTVTGAGAVTYAWTGGIVDGVPFIPPVGVTTYTVTGTDAQGCTGTDDMTITVNPLPTINAGPDQTVCDGATVTLSGSGGVSYVWPGGVVDGIPFTPAVGTTTYTVVGTDANGCQNTDDVDVIVNPLPVVGAGPDQTICDGGTVTLSGTGAVSYAWTGGVVDGTPFSPTVGTTTFTVTGTDANGCINTDAADVTVNPLDDPSFTYPAGLTHCVSGPDPTATITGMPGGTFSYVVTGGGPTLNLNPATGDITLAGSNVGSYDVTYSTAGAGGSLCPQTSTLTITITNAPIADFFIDDFCANVGDPLPTFTGGGSAGVFTGPAGLVINPTTGEIDLDASTPGTYTVTNTINVPGCALVVFTEDMTIFDVPTATIAGSTTICQGAALPDLTVDVIGGTGPFTVDYLFDGTPQPALAIPGTSTTITGAAVGTYDLTMVTDANGCIGTITGETAVIDEFPVPVMDPIADVEVCANDVLNIPAFTSSLPGDLYAWTNTGTDVGFGTAGTGLIGAFTGINAGTTDITVTVDVTPTSSNGCLGLPTSFNVTIHPLPSPGLNPDVTQGCEPLTVNFTEDATVPPPSSSCVWDFGDGTTATGCGSVSHTFNTEGTYTISLTTTTIDGCTATFTANDLIIVTPLPVAEFVFNPQVITIEDTEVSFDNFSINADEYEWDFADESPINTETSPTHEFPTVPGEYIVTLTAMNNNGVCVDTYQQLVVVKDIILFYVPNVFTPDGDEYNETFQPVFYSGFDPFDFHLTLFNRWGEVVFESFDASIGWNGTYGDRGLVKDGVYIWQIEFKETMSDKKHKHRGHVTILK